MPELDRGGRVDLDDGRARLASGAELHEVRLTRDQAGREVFRPRRIEAAPGDAVRFESDYSGTHAFGFDRARLNPEQQAFLASTHQLSSPPLIERGAAWVVGLEDAPPGEYPFRCLTHDVSGALLVGRSR